MAESSTVQAARRQSVFCVHMRDRLQLNLLDSSRRRTQRQRLKRV
jgi:hypothetical protein